MLKRLGTGTIAAVIAIVVVLTVVVASPGLAKKHKHSSGGSSSGMMGPQGPAGPQGPQGAPGPQGPADSTTLWAVIEANGLADSYKGLTGNQRLGKGQYQIDFNRDISQCAYTATIMGLPSGEITTRNFGPQSVEALTAKDDGSLAEDHPFYLVVNC